MKQTQRVHVNLGSGVHLLGGWINVDKSFTLKDLKKKKGVFSNAIVEKGATFIQADMKKLPFKKDSVDYIECIDALEYLPFRDVEKAISEMHRVLKPGGIAYLFVPDFDDIAKIWVNYIAGAPFSPTNWFNMANIIYGSQVQEGEFRRAAFNAEYLNGLIQACGFTSFKMTSFPRGSLPPRFKGAKWPRKPMGVAMIGIEALKI